MLHFLLSLSNYITLFDLYLFKNIFLFYHLNLIQYFQMKDRPLNFLSYSQEVIDDVYNCDATGFRLNIASKLCCLKILLKI